MPIKKFYEEYETKNILLPKEDQLKIINETLNGYIKNGQTTDAIFLKGFMNLIQGNLDYALIAFNEVDTEHPFHYLGIGLVQIKLAQRTYDLEICKDAITSLEETNRKYSEQFSERFLIGEYHLGQALYLNGLIGFPEHIKSFEDAEEIFNSLIQQGYNPPYCLNELGNIAMKRYDNKVIALEHYDNAIEKNKNFSRPYNGRGNIYRHQKKWKSAIKEYREALLYEPDFYYPNNYLGDCNRILENYEEAIDYYEAAIKINSHISYAWYGLGRVYYELGNRKLEPKYYDLAKAKILKALEINPNFGHALHDYAKILEKNGDLVSAKTKYQEYYNLITTVEGKEYIKNKITEIEKSEIFYSKLIIGQDKEDIVTKILSKTHHIEDTTNFAKDTFTHSFFNNVPILECDSEVVYLEILRRWNSYTPIVRGNSKGGGYFIKAFGKGIIIDPGFNFIENFIEAGHRFCEIDTILISHAHDDHTADLESIISLLLRYNEHLRETIIPRELAKEHNTSKIYESLKEGIVHERWKLGKKHIDVYLSMGANVKYEGLFQNDQSNCGNESADPEKCKNCYSVNPVEVGEVFYHISNDNVTNVTIQAIYANHKDLNGQDCLGFIVDFPTLNTSIVYTGDTGWNGMKNPYEKIKKELASRKILLLAHIGGFKPIERDYLDPEKGPKDYLYKQHLGRIGLAQLNEILTPDLCIISEYGEEFEHFRLAIAEIFDSVFSSSFKKKKIHKAIKFIPADIGLTISISDNILIKAISELDFGGKTFQTSLCEFADIKPGESSLKNKIFYYKKDLEERDCIKAIDSFTEKFDNQSYHNLVLSRSYPS